MKLPVRLIYSDVDETLRVAGTISDRAQHCIRIFARRNIPFGLATGRCLSRVQQTLVSARVRITAPWILNNGATVYCHQNNHSLYHQRFDLHVSTQLLDIDWSQVHYAVFSPCERGSRYWAYAADQEQMAFVRHEMKSLLFQERFCHRTFLHDLQGLTTAKLAFGLKQQIQFPASVNAYFVKGWGADVTPLGTSKCEGIRIAARHLGIPLQQVAFCGNDVNDECVLACEEIGFRFLIGHTCPEFAGIPGIRHVDQVEEAFEQLLPSRRRRAKPQHQTTHRCLS